VFSNLDGCNRRTVTDRLIMMQAPWR